MDFEFSTLFRLQSETIRNIRFVLIEIYVDTHVVDYGNGSFVKGKPNTEG